MRENIMTERVVSMTRTNNSRIVLPKLHHPSNTCRSQVRVRKASLARDAFYDEHNMPKTSLRVAYASLLTRARLIANPGQDALITRLALLQDSLLTSQNGPQKGVYIYGSVGTGKSKIADLFAATMPPEVTSRRIHFHEFMMDIHTRLHHARSQKSFSGDPLVQIGKEVQKESRVLCFDEFQVTDIADAMILKRLFTSIWEAGGVMVSTSNRPPQGLYENGLNRGLFLPFIAELQRRCEVWRMEGTEDYRMGKGMSNTNSDDGRTEVFLTSKTTFERALVEATGAVEMKQKVIPVLMSRQLKVLAAAPAHEPRGKLIVSATFKDLCETFLGSADYHALCKAADTIFLTGLRQFRADELDFVRRFITLVDLAYEAKTRIVCLSSVPLFDVFSNIVPNEMTETLERQMTVKGKGGSSSSMMSTFVGEMEWSATGLAKASLASGGAGETDVRFAIGRAVSRLFEMGWKQYGVGD